MRRVVIGTILVALTLIVLSPLLSAQEPTGPKAPPKGTPGKVPPVIKRKGLKGKAALKKALRRPNGQPLGRYAVQYGVSLRGGAICYPGALHRPWALRHYSPAWRLWLLFDPNTGQWYFWHPALRGYYPMSYLLTRTPLLQPPGITPAQALNNTVPINVANVPMANGANVPNVPNVPRNLRGAPLR